MAVEIRAEGLGAGYGGRTVWRGMDFVIDRPGLVSIIGPNGVGKSTLMHTMNGIIEPREGRVLLNGRNVSDMNPREMAEIVAYVPQASDETFPMSVMDTVLMGRYPRSGYVTTEEDLGVAADCLELLGISDLAMRGFDELSAGQHQKVMIGRGLAQEPGVLLLDEPTSNLDIYHQLYVMKLLRDIAREKDMIVIAICHDLNVASRFSDRIILLSNGRIHADGTAEEVVTPNNIEEVYGVRAEIVPVDGRPYAIFHADESSSLGSRRLRRAAKAIGRRGVWHMTSHEPPARNRTQFKYDAIHGTSEEILCHFSTTRKTPVQPCGSSVSSRSSWESSD